MKCFIMMMCLFISPLSYSQSIHINDLNFTYSNPSGYGSAKGIELEVQRVAEDFIITSKGIHDEEFTLKDAPSFLTEADSMDIKNLNFVLEDKIQIDLKRAHFYSPENRLELDNFSLNCLKDKSESEEMDQLISGCARSIHLKSSKFHSSFVGEAIESLLEVYSSKVNVNSIELKSQNGKFNLTADVRAQISGKVRGKGEMSYNSEAKEMVLKISEVKFGILNITNKVFDELRKQKIENLTVKAPYIYYKLK